MNSELQIIEKEAFCESNISSISIPSHVTYIGETPFNRCYHFQIIEFQDNLDINRINPNVFYNCRALIMISSNMRHLIVNE